MFNDVFCTNKHRSLFNSTPTTLSRAVLIYEQSSLIHPKIHRATQARDAQMAAPPKPRKWETRRRLFSHRRRNKILSRSNFPGKSKFSGSNSFCTGSCPRFYVLANEVRVSWLPEEIPRESRVEVKGRGITLIVPLQLRLSSLGFLQGGTCWGSYSSSRFFEFIERNATFEHK